MHDDAVVLASRQVIGDDFAKGLGEQPLVDAFNGGMNLFLARGDPARSVPCVAHELLVAFVIVCNDLEHRTAVALVGAFLVRLGHAVDFGVAHEQCLFTVPTGTMRSEGMPASLK